MRSGKGAQNIGLERGEGPLTLDSRFNSLARTYGRVLHGFIGKFFEVHT